MFPPAQGADPGPGEHVHLRYISSPLICLPVTQVSAPEDRRGPPSLYLFINGPFAPQPLLLAPVSPPRVRNHASAHGQACASSIHLMPKHEWGGGHDKEGAGRRAGLPGGREVSSYIDCFRKRILQLLAAQLNKSGCSKGSDGISRPPQGPRWITQRRRKSDEHFDLFT